MTVNPQENAVSNDPQEIKALEERLANGRAKAASESPASMATNTDPELNKAFSEESGVSTGYEGITPAADPDEEPTGEDEEEAEPDAVTAFIVVVQADGSCQISTDLGIKLSVLRESTLLDVRRACDELLFNLRNQAVSENTVVLMNQFMQQTAEQARIAKVQQKLASKGINVPVGRG